ncbi:MULTISPECIES: hypothetical protein [Limosilactobacillus]|uniref:Uncharacterized protein n=2 Tax=Limosilactobacillus pontis TaxID=35787 RepID=A0ABU7SUX7_9LACO|nr:hypothetical protein [Limosilactobacillus pontis]KRM36450.1 hypothetical protein FD34_GL000155 [Limosilactobacillus pontis DSM 8475]MCX2187518.1 hypothetical protein [Limosilactobacillus pontis]MCX2189263.1 hypothetical protein [Limosilactobacillus pontis]QFV00645.1 hypothetical protein LP475_02385 [Limosilactobacillus pontis]
MASNSDSIYYVLTKIKRHPELIMMQQPRYTNTIMMAINDSLKIADAGYYFPNLSLMVNRLSNDFVAKNEDLLDDYFAKTNSEQPIYHDVWVTTSHLPAKGAYLLELSYE